MVFLWLAGRSGPPVLRPNQCRRCMADQEDQPAEHDPPDREAGGAGGKGHAILLHPRRERSRPVRGERVDADRRGKDGTAGFFDGTGPSLLRRDRTAMGGVHWKKSRPANRQPGFWDCCQSSMTAVAAPGEDAIVENKNA